MSSRSMIMTNDNERCKGKSVASIYNGRFSVNQWRMDIVAGDVLPS